MTSVQKATRRRPRRTYSPRMPAQARREQLMDAALDLIERDGYRAVSVEAIVRELDVTRPVFYNVYSDLDALLSDLLDRQEARAMQQLTARIAPPQLGGDLRAYLHDVVVALVTMVAEDGRTWKPIFHASLDTPALARERIDRDRELIRQRFVLLLSLGVASDTGADLPLLSHALVAIGEYFARMILDDPASIDADRLAATITALVPLP